MVQLHLGPPRPRGSAPGPMLQLDTGTFGALAQLGERLICIQEVRSSILLGSTILRVVCVSCE